MARICEMTMSMPEQLRQRTTVPGPAQVGDRADCLVARPQLLGEVRRGSAIIEPLHRDRQQLAGRQAIEYDRSAQ